MNLRIKIEVYSHYCKVMPLNYPATELIERYVGHNLVQMRYEKDKRTGISKKVPDKVYAVKHTLNSGNVYRIHRHCLEDFLKLAYERGFPRETIQLTHIPLYEPATADFAVQERWSDRDYQIPVIAFMEDKDKPTAMVELQTGKGKTYTALRAIATIAKRLVIVVKPCYMEKWYDDLKTTYHIGDDKILTVSGSGQLRGLIDLALINELTADAIIISNKTLQLYVKHYLLYGGDFPDAMYGVPADKLFETLRAGVLLVDEVHQDFHLVFTALLHTHVPKHIALSATLLNYDRFIESMYYVAYPKSVRYNDGEYDRYIEMYPVSFQFRFPEKIKTSEPGSSTYSHIAFEKSIIRQPLVLRNWLEGIVKLIERGYIGRYEVGDRLAIYASSVEMCTIITEHLRKEYPKLDVRRYVAEDPYENATDADIRVTTILSSGTGIDIKRLTTVILTINVNSIQANIQVLGRLRKLEDKAVQFYYLFSTQLKKHIDYHEQRRTSLRNRVKSIKQLDLPIVV